MGYSGFNNYNSYGGYGKGFGGGPQFSERDLMKQELLNKTRICRHWQVGMEREPYLTADECMQKYCPHKDRCFFAHGEHELRVLPARGQGLASSGMMPGQPQGGGPLTLEQRAMVTQQETVCLCLKPYSKVNLWPICSIADLNPQAAARLGASKGIPPRHVVRPGEASGPPGP